MSGPSGAPPERTNMMRAVRAGAERGHLRSAVVRMIGSVLLLLVVVVPGARAATITVTSPGDAEAADGAVSLREAIDSIDGAASINADVQPVGPYGADDTIAFALAPGQTILLASPRPALTQPMTIDGTTQPGATGTPKVGVVLDADLTATARVTVRGVQLRGIASTRCARVATWPTCAR